MAALGWFALGSQFFLVIATTQTAGKSETEAIINYFSFFTILTNLLLAVGLSCFLLKPASRIGRFFWRPAVRTGLALYIGVVGAVYMLVLRELWNPQGLQKMADVLLHELVPALYVVYWALFVSRVRLAWSNVWLWLIYPAVYLFYTLVRGVFRGWYPYPFVDVQAIGYGRVAWNAAGLLVVFVLAGAAMVAIGRWRTRGNL